MPQATPSSEGRSLTFLAGGQRLGLPAVQIAEVTALPTLTRVPLSPPGLRGLASVRGQVTPVLSLGALLGSDDAADERQIVVIDSSTPCALAVTQVTGVSADDEFRELDLDALVQTVLSGFANRKISAGRDVRTLEVADEAPGEALLVFTLAGQGYALPLSEVVEVSCVPGDLSVVPRADSVSLGVASLRDEVVPVLSLRALLGLGDDQIVSSSRLVVAEIGEGKVGLIVDGLKTVLRLAQTEVAVLPSVLNRGGGEARIAGIVRTSQGLVSVLSVQSLLDEETTARFSGQGVANADAPHTATVSTARRESFVKFQLGRECYALPASAALKVIAFPNAPTRVPRAPDFLLGLMNHEGKVTPLIDQRRRFGVAAAAEQSSARHVIVAEVGGVAAGLVVDAVEGVIDIPGADIRSSPPVTGDATVFDRVALGQGESNPLLVVDPRQLLDQAQRDVVFRALARAESASS